MKDICLTHFDTNIRLPTYFIHYFRIIGVYVYDKVILDDIEYNTLDTLKNRFEIQVTILSNSFNYQLNDNDAYGNAIYLVPESISNPFNLDCLEKQNKTL